MGTLEELRTVVRSERKGTREETGAIGRSFGVPAPRPGAGVQAYL